jgi:hypothetical protein
MSLDIFLKNFEDSLKQIAGDLQDHALSQSQLNHTLLMLQQQLNIQKNLIDSNLNVLNNEAKDVIKNMKHLAEMLVPEIKTIEDIPIAKHPKWYVVEMPEDRPSTNANLSTEYVNINPEGPFVISNIIPLFQVTKPQTEGFSGFANPVVGGNSPIGRILPCTSFQNLCQNLGRTNITSFGYTTPSLWQLNFFQLIGDASNWGPLADIPEYEFQIEIGGSGRFWTNQFVPAAAFYGTMGNPGYLGCLGWVDRADRLIVHSRNIKPIGYYGRVLFIFHGYQMLGHIDIAKALGY